MSRHQIFAQKQIVLDSEEISMFGASDSSFTFNAKEVITTVDDNLSLGSGALANLTTGSDNIAVGPTAGTAYVSTESDNIVIGNVGVVSDQGTIRLGNTDQVLCYVSGIYGVTSAGASAAVINSSGKLGTVVSSQKRKRDIEDIGSEEVGKFCRLQPKRFKMNDDPSGELHYGFIAEDVEMLMPDLVVKDEKGAPLTVQYQKLDALHVAAIQSMLKSIEEQKRQLADLQVAVAKLLLQ